MAIFYDTESDKARLDYQLLRHWGTVLYYSEALLEADLEWLREAGYVIHDFDARRWKTEGEFHVEVASALGFPGWYGENLDAFNDCMRDVLAPSDGGMAIVIREADSLRFREGRFLSVVLDILAVATRANLLFGRRLLTLVHSRDPEMEIPPVGAMLATWNQQEFLNSSRGV
jgi:RNAse (barnase) inhibitor barstar